MSLVTRSEALARFSAAGGRLVGVRQRPFRDAVLIRIDMPDPASAAWARGLVGAAGLAVGGNDTEWERQVVVTVPAALLDEHYPGWRATLGDGRRRLGP